MFVQKVIRTVVISPILGIISLFFLLGLLVCLISEEYGWLYADWWKNTVEGTGLWMK